MPAQSELSAADIKQKLVGYTLVKPNQIVNLKAGDRVRYKSQNQFRMGGVVRSNKFPDYIVLVNLQN